jgi:hypothetical protein
VLACPASSRKRPANQPGTRTGHGRRAHAWDRLRWLCRLPLVLCWHATASTVPRVHGQSRPPGQATGRQEGAIMTEASRSFAGNPPTSQSCGTPRVGSPGPCPGGRCRAGGTRRRRSHRGRVARPGRACGRVAGQPQQSLHRVGRDAPSPIGARRGRRRDIVVRGETGDQTRSGIEKRRPRAAANVTAMDITIHASFLPHDDPSAAGQAHSYTSFIAFGRSSNGRSEHEANAQEEAMPKR